MAKKKIVNKKTVVAKKTIAPIKPTIKETTKKVVEVKKPIVEPSIKKEIKPIEKAPIAVKKVNTSIKKTVVKKETPVMFAKIEEPKINPIIEAETTKIEVEPIKDEVINAIEEVVNVINEPNPLKAEMISQGTKESKETPDTALLVLNNNNINKDVQEKMQGCIPHIEGFFRKMMKKEVVELINNNIGLEWLVTINKNGNNAEVTATFENQTASILVSAEKFLD
jgi:hypothetical protein